MLKLRCRVFQNRNNTVEAPGFASPNPIPRPFDSETDSDPDPDLASPWTFSDEPLDIPFQQATSSSYLRPRRKSSPSEPEDPS
ncbi:MAG: hypothetical protein ACOX52_21310 [Verrucomicrobiota bacterium]